MFLSMARSCGACTMQSIKILLLHLELINCHNLEIFLLVIYYHLQYRVSFAFMRSLFKISDYLLCKEYKSSYPYFCGRTTND